MSVAWFIAAAVSVEELSRGAGESRAVKRTPRRQGEPCTPSSRSTVRSRADVLLTQVRHVADRATRSRSGFEYLVATLDGEPVDPAAFVTATPSWSIGETFMAGAAPFRIVGKSNDID